MPLAWEPRGARIAVISPVQQPIVDFDRAASCVAWWSTSTPAGGVEAELVDVGTGEREEDYAGKDLAGKVAFVNNANWHVTWSHVSELIARKGAIGIVTDFFLYPTPPIRTRERIPDAVQLAAAGIQRHSSVRFLGLLGRLSDRREALRMAEGSALSRIHADVHCETFVGHGRNILATIEGSELPEELVFVLAHSSTGSRPGANCASGAALLAEVARALNRLILAGDVPRPRRSLKFLLVSEGFGSCNYIEAHEEEMRHVKASYCLESVGHSQRKLNGTLYFSGAPEFDPVLRQRPFRRRARADAEALGLGRPERAGHLADRCLAGPLHALERQQHLGRAWRPEHALHVVARRVFPLAAAHRRGHRPFVFAYSGAWSPPRPTRWRRPAREEAHWLAHLALREERRAPSSRHAVSSLGCRSPTGSDVDGQAAGLTYVAAIARPSLRFPSLASAEDLPPLQAEDLIAAATADRR